MSATLAETTAPHRSCPTAARYDPGSDSRPLIPRRRPCAAAPSTASTPPGHPRSTYPASVSPTHRRPGYFPTTLARVSSPRAHRRGYTGPESRRILHLHIAPTKTGNPATRPASPRHRRLVAARPRLSRRRPAAGETAAPSAHGPETILAATYRPGRR